MLHYCSWKVYLEVINAAFYIFKIFHLISIFTILATYSKILITEVT